MSEPAAGSAPSDSSAPGNLNLPNLLTTLRIVLVPFFAWALLTDHGHDASWRVAAWAIFGEPIGVVQVLGGAIVLAGIWVSKKGS